jgi:hypothetical protein
MGLFDKRDKRRKDDFDSPVESIDLSQVGGADQAEASSEPAAEASSEPAAAAPAAAASEPEVRPTRRRAQPEPAGPEVDTYGIDKAIELMRTLPQENVQLVVQVVKFSLESVGIKLPVIIDDAIRRQKDLRGRVDVLKAEITDLESEIKQRREEIERHEGDYAETTTVRERLELAEGLGKKGDSKAAAHATGAHSTGAHPTPAAPVLPRASRTTNPPSLSTSPATLGAPPAKK